MTAGTIVYISGATGNKPLIAKALATGDATSAQTYGLLQADIANNADGYVVVVGNVGSLDTSALTEGQQLYLSGTTAGAYTTTKPYAPTHLVYIGIVLRSHPTQGIIGVKIQNGYEMDELHNVDAQSPSNNDILSYNTTTSLWEHKQIATTLGFTPISLASLSATSPLSYNNTTGAFSIQVATASQNGYLSSTDWSTFNNKQAALGGTGFVKISGSTISYDNSTYYLASNPSGYITLSSLSAGDGISYSNTTGVISSTITQYTDALARAAISSSATGLTYTSATGVFSLTAGYAIPTTAKQTEWDTAYTNRITSLTTTGSSGEATLVSNTLNVPTYTLSGLGGQPLDADLTAIAGLTGTSGFLKKNAADTWSLDTNTYVTTTTAQTISGAKTFSASPIIDGGFATAIPLRFKQYDSASFNSDGYTDLYVMNAYRFGFAFNQGSSNYKGFTFNVNGITLNTSREYTMPDAAGTLALTSDIPSLANYVTLNGTQTISGNKTFSGVNSFTGATSFSYATTFMNGTSLNWTAAGSHTGGTLTLSSAHSGSTSSLILSDGDTAKYIYFSFTNTATGIKTYTLPDTSGTIALTSNIPTNNNQLTNGAGYITSASLSGYLPLTGGTLTNTGGNGTPILNYVGSSTDAYQWITNGLNSVLGVGNTMIHILGKSITNKNAGYFGYQWNADQSNTNFISLGFINFDHLFKLYPNGNAVVSGALSASNLSGTNTGDQTLASVVALGSSTLSTISVGNGDNGLTGINIRRGRLCFSNSYEANHSIYNNYYNIDSEGVYDGIKMNVYNGLKIRTGNAASGVPTTIFSLDSTGVAITGALTATNLSGTNTGDQSLAGLGGVPTSRTLTINGTGYDLSADRSWTVTGTDATKLPLAGGVLTGSVTSNLTNAYAYVLNRPAITNYIGLQYQTAASNKWFVGLREISTNHYYIYNEVLGSNAVTIDSTNNYATFASQLQANSIYFDESGVRSWSITKSGGNLNYNSGDGAGTASFGTAISSSKYIGVTRAGANGVGEGPYVVIAQPTSAIQWLMQLNASAGLDYWHYSGSAWSTPLKLQSNGFVSIGGVAAGSKLSIYDGDIRLYKPHVIAGGESWKAYINFTDEIDRLGARIVGERTAWDGAPMGIGFDTGGVGSVTRKMTITSAGQINISGANDGGTPILNILTTGNGAWQRGIRLQNSTMSAGSSIMISAGYADSSYNQGQFYFYYAGAGSTSNRISMGLHSVDDVFNIMGTGNILVNTTSENGFGSAKSIQINGASGSLLETRYNGTSGLRIGSGSDHSYHHDPRNAEMRFATSDSTRFYIYGNGNYDFTGTDVSDRRAKTNISILGMSATDKIMSLVAKTYNMKNNPSQIRYGFIAQEVKEIVSDLVIGDENNGYLGLDYNGLLTLAIITLQEQQKEIQILKQK